MKSVLRYREQRYICGDYLEVNLYPVWEQRKDGKRAGKRKPTSETQERLNQLHAERELERRINANFTSDDLKLELTYSPENYPDSKERAQKDLKNFFARLSRLRKKKGLEPLKYIYAYGEGSEKGRIHFHLIINGGLSIGEIAKTWGKGYVDKILPLQFSETGCSGLAKYFARQQESKRKAENPDTVSEVKHKKRFVCSKNLIKPKPKTNDFKYSKRKVERLVKEQDYKQAFQKAYPDYFFADCKEVYIEQTGLWCLFVRMYSKNADLGIRLRH